MKKNFDLRTLVWLLFVPVLLFSCKKENDDTILPDDKYYFRCKIDGVLENYPVAMNACGFYADYTLGTKGFGASGSIPGKSALTVVITDFTGNTIKSDSIYKANYIAGTGVTKLQAFISFTDGITGVGYNSTITPGEFVSPAPESAEIILTEITSAYVKGKFKGNLLVDETMSNDIKYRITDGEFYLPRSADVITGPSVDDELISFSLDGSDYMIKENGSPLIVTQAEFVDSKQLIISGIDYSPGKSTNFSFAIKDSSDIVNKIYNINNVNYIQTNCIVNFNTKSSGGTDLNYISMIGSASGSSAEIKFTKFSKEKGQYIEGDFLVTNGIFKSGSDVPLSITKGKFRLKVK